MVARASANGPAHGGCTPICGDPIDLGTGLFVHTETDFTIQDIIPITLTRTYRPNDPYSRAFGIGTNHPYDIFLYNENGQYQTIDLILSDGGRIRFDKSPSGSGYICTSSPTIFYGATLAEQEPNGGWLLKRKDGTILTFPVSDTASTPQQEAIVGYQDRYGNKLTFTRDAHSNLTRIDSPNGRNIQFTLDGSGRITQATDNMGRVVTYGYDSGGRLSSVTDANGNMTSYTFDASNNMITVTDARKIKRATNTYDSNNRLIEQVLADGSTYHVSYILDEDGVVLQATSTDPRKNIRQTTFNSSGFALTDSLAVGTPDQELTTYNRDALTNLVMIMTDSLNRTTSYRYDDLGNLTGLTQLYGTPNALTIFTRMTQSTAKSRRSQIRSAISPPLRTTILAISSRLPTRSAISGRTRTMGAVNSYRRPTP